MGKDGITNAVILVDRVFLRNRVKELAVLRGRVDPGGVLRRLRLG